MVRKQWQWKQNKALKILDSSESAKTTLVFKNKEEKDRFMGQLSDGWGENYCSLTWFGDFYDAKEVVVDVFDEGVEW